jgi:hypothetical protein
MVTPRDIRVAIISRIWAYATIMMGLSVLFGGPGRNSKVIFLPATIALGAAVSTIVVWGKSQDRQRDVLLPSSNFEELKQRIENLEAIAASNDAPLEYALKQPSGSTKREIYD